MSDHIISTKPRCEYCGRTYEHKQSCPNFVYIAFFEIEGDNIVKIDRGVPFSTYKDGLPF